MYVLRDIDQSRDLDSSKVNGINPIYSKTVKILLFISGSIFLGLGFSVLLGGRPFSGIIGMVIGVSLVLYGFLNLYSLAAMVMKAVIYLGTTVFLSFLILNNPAESLALIWLFPYLLMVFYLFPPLASVLLSLGYMAILITLNLLVYFEILPAKFNPEAIALVRIYSAYIITITIMFFTSYLFSKVEKSLRDKNGELKEAYDGATQLSRELEISRKNYMEIIRRAKDGIVLIQNDKVVFCNSSFMDMIGYTSHEILGQTYTGFFSDDYRQSIRDHIAKFKMHPEDENQVTVSELQSKTGECIAVEINNAVILYYGDESDLIFVRDIRIRKSSEDKLRFMAYYDELTSLLNRKSFYERMERAIDLGRRRNFMDTWALLYIDLDNFKDVNDSLGHGAGDEVLLEVSKRLKDSVRDSDDIFRIAGDEFAVILGTITTMTDAGYVARKILHSLASPFMLMDREITVTASIGVSVYPKDGTDADILIKNADMAMYEAKRHKNKYHFFDSYLDRELEKRIEVSRDLRKALENEEFNLYYQPIMDDTGTIVAAEALIRWMHPEKGILAPGYFLAIAEEIGFIKEIEKWVIQKVCMQIRDWLDRGLQVVPVSLNVTAYLLSDPNFLTYFIMYTERYSVPPHYLKVEITESSSMSNPDDVRHKMEQLAEEGFTIMIDDFGTGYSSLAYLNRFPAQTLKIDRSFILPIPDDDDAAVLVSSIVTLAHNLGFTVIAEGVENEEQRKYLHSAVCDLQQGYLYSPPISVEEFEAFLKKHFQGRAEA